MLLNKIMFQLKMENISKIVLINNKNNFLLQLRDENPNIICPGQWGLFGGGVEKNEKPLEGLLREVGEEIPDCKVFDIQFLKSFFYTPLNHKVYIFKGIINEEIDYINKKLTEGQRAEFFDFYELENIKFSPVEKNFIYENKNLIIN
jgi:8-oxo-dGTP pyrophosphatase MutT (NUDIX family)